MDNEILTALISLFGIIFSVILSCTISSKLGLIKTQSEFSKQLYKKRLKSYLEIYELVSNFVKIINRRKISFEKMKEFYEKYSILDSKYGLLFSYTIHSSSELIKETNKILTGKKIDDAIDEEIKKKLINKLGNVELAMKYELGVFAFKNPSTIMKRFKLPEKYREALAKLDERW